MNAVTSTGVSRLGKFREVDTGRIKSDGQDGWHPLSPTVGIRSKIRTFRRRIRRQRLRSRAGPYRQRVAGRVERVGGHRQRAVGVAVDQHVGRPRRPRRRGRRGRAAAGSGRASARRWSKSGCSSSRGDVGRGRSSISRVACSSKRCAQSKPASGVRPVDAAQVVHDVAAADDQHAARRAAAPAARRARGGTRAACSALIDSCTTGMSASGNTCTSTDQVPWSRPQLSWSAPDPVGLARPRRPRSASSGSPGAGYSTVEQLAGEAVEVVDGPRPRHRRHRGGVDVPVRGHHQDRARPRHRRAERAPGLGVAVALERVHRAAVAEERRRHAAVGHRFPRRGCGRQRYTGATRARMNANGRASGPLANAPRVATHPDPVLRRTALASACRPDESMPMQLEGSCHCGKVRFRCEAYAPVPYQYCYCSICRKTASRSGSAINLGARADTLQVEGREHLGVYHAHRRRRWQLPHQFRTAAFLHGLRQCVMAVQPGVAGPGPSACVGHRYPRCRPRPSACTCCWIRRRTGCPCPTAATTCMSMAFRRNRWSNGIGDMRFSTARRRSRKEVDARGGALVPSAFRWSTGQFRHAGCALQRIAMRPPINGCLRVSQGAGWNRLHPQQSADGWARRGRRSTVARRGSPLRRDP